MFTEAIAAFPFVVIPSILAGLAGLLKVIFDFWIAKRKANHKNKITLTKLQ